MFIGYMELMIILSNHLNNDLLRSITTTYLSHEFKVYLRLYVRYQYLYVS